MEQQMYLRYKHYKPNPDKTQATKWVQVGIFEHPINFKPLRNNIDNKYELISTKPYPKLLNDTK